MFAGLISKEQTVSAWGDATKIMAALAPFSLDKPRDYWASDKLMLLQVNTRNDAVSAEIYRHPDSGLAVAFWGRLDNRPDLIAQLHATSKSSDDELIALAWLKWGEHCPEKLIGDFAFAVASPNTGVVFLARDVMGVKPLYYRTDENGVFFANSAAAFKPLQLGTLTRSQEWMARYMLDLSSSHTTTAYVEIKKLPGAHSLLIHADGRMNLRRYHQFVDDAPVEKRREPKYLEAYRAAWEEAVACRMPASGNIGTENSGGLDSGSITAEIARQLGQDITRLHGMGFCYEPLEPAHIMATAMKWSIKNNTLFSHNQERAESTILERVFKVNGYPQEHINGSLHTPMYELCVQNGITTLFSGFGGDEVVTNPAIWPVRFELFDQGLWPSLWNVLPGQIPFKLARLVKTLIRANSEMPKHNVHLLKAWHERWPFQFLRKKILEEYNLQRDYFDSATYDERFRSLNEAAIYLIGRECVPARLENCSLMAASYGIDYVWPMWDSRLMQQWLSTPVIWKIGDGGVTRYLHRKSAEDVSATEVVWKQSKSMRAGLGWKYSDDEISKLLIQLDKLLNTMPLELGKLVDMQRLQILVDNSFKDLKTYEKAIEALSLNIPTLSEISAWIVSEINKADG